MKVTILANCQFGGYHKALERILPDAEINSFTPSAGTAGDWAPHLKDSDLILTQEFKGAAHGDAQTEVLRASSAQVALLPKVYFDGYHPDITYVRTLTVRETGALADYHSSIAIAGFLAGRTPEQTLAMYNKFVYSRAGFLDALDLARLLLLQHFRELGLDLEEKLDRWIADGPFMYTVNHPKIHVLDDIIRSVVEQIGVQPSEARDEPLYDRLANGVRWPVYADIAKHLNVPGDPMRLTRANKASPFDVDWLEFIRRSHAIYQKADEEVLRTPRVNKVLDVL